MTERVFQLIGSCNNFPWGKKGSDSLAARLCAKFDKQFSAKNDEPYSELWFGDYPDYPARVLSTRELLSDVLDKNKEVLLGKKVIEEELLYSDGKQKGQHLPYLPKILSIDKALPLQIHPDKYLAEKLHKQDPDSFPDANHKPEIAIALTQFEVFAGFKPACEIKALFTSIPALRKFVPENPPEKWDDNILRQITLSLLSASPETVKSVESDLQSFPSDKLAKNQAYIQDLLPRLQKQYSSTDPGTLVALLTMNFMTLLPGEALYIPADGIHAYLSGDIVECMARSNNVVNAGFCGPSERHDLKLFTESLTFREQNAMDLYLPYEEINDKKTRVYNPPIREFRVLRTQLKGAGQQKERLEKNDGPAVFIVTSGQGKLKADGKEFGLEEGSIFFVAPGVEVEFEAAGSAAGEDEVAFEAFTIAV
ncbi:mannose-6-phosphate isomerase [Naviculisporaceae sp. PSN 640]